MAGQPAPGVIGTSPPASGEAAGGDQWSNANRFLPPGPIRTDGNDAIPLAVTRTIKVVVKDWEPPVPAASQTVVNGKTLEDVAIALNKRGEWGQGGGTLQNDAVPVGTSAEVTVKLHANLVLRMPRWSGYAQASAAAKAEWDRMIVSLKAHEDRHVAIAIEEANSLAAALIGEEIDKLASMVTAANKTMHDRQVDLDTTTDHGSKEKVPFGDVFLDISIT